LRIHYGQEGTIAQNRGGGKRGVERYRRNWRENKTPGNRDQVKMRFKQKKDTIKNTKIKADGKLKRVNRRKPGKENYRGSGSVFER